MSDKWTGDVKVSTCTGHVFGLTMQEVEEYSAQCRGEPVPPPEPKLEGRVCTRCGRRLPDSEFYPDKWSSTGYSSSCKSCERARARARYRGEH